MENLVVKDCEVYPNYFLVAFKELTTGKTVTIEARGKDVGLSFEDQQRLRSIMTKRFTFGFNSRNYDMPVILYALKGKTCDKIFQLSNFIIGGNSHGWQTCAKFGLSKPQSFKCFDIQEPGPGVKISLKLYGARMHSKTLQDLPFEVGTELTDRQMDEVKLYCINDLDTTIDLFNRIRERMQLRFDMAEQYGDIVISKSDAQIAEVVIKQELQKISKVKIQAPKIPVGTKFRYEVPSYIKFKDPQLRHALKLIRSHEFELDGKGSIKLPKEIKALKIKLGYSTYKLGIGGLHSNEKKQTVVANKNQLLIDKDVASYYPNIILNNNLYPRHLGPDFLNVYRKIVKERIAAKKAGNKIVDAALKLVINGSYGKLGNKYSVIYSPDLMIAVTLTGQLSLLMLIEQLEDAGINVMSANTDGFVSLMPKDKYELFDTICFQWELDANFPLEQKEYKALYSRDVNNYIAITKDNDYKVKGQYTIDKKAVIPLSKNPEAEICAEAVIAYLKDNVPIEKTIRACDDVRKFLCARSVTGGAVWRGKYLGRVVRWIWSTEGEEIRRNKLKDKQTVGDKVANSDGARPIMKLGEFPPDIDYSKYIGEAQDMLTDLGLYNL